MMKYLGPAAAAAAFHAALLAAYVAALGGDPAALVCVGENRIGQPPYEAVHVSRKIDGYDGQYYYAIARAPLRRQSAGIDVPAFRQARLLYPLASWVFSGGDVRLLPWAMPAVNLLAIAILAGAGAFVAARHGLSPWYGFFLPLAADASLPALRDLTDVTSTCAVCVLLAVWLARGPAAGLALAGLAALFAREQNVAIVLMVLAGVAWRRQWPAVLGLTAVLILWSGWLVALRLTYGYWPVAATGGLLGLPGRGVFFRLSHLSEGGSAVAALVNAACILLLLARAGLAVYLLLTPADRVTVLVALAGAALAAAGGVPLYEEKWGYMRVFAWLPLGCWLGCVQARLRVPAVAMACTVMLPVGVVLLAFCGGRTL